MPDGSEVKMNASSIDELTGKVASLRRTGDKFELAKGLRDLGKFERRFPSKRGDFLTHYREAVELFRSCDDPLRLAHTVRHLGNIYHEDGNMIAAEACLSESLEIYSNCDEIGRAHV